MTMLRNIAVWTGGAALLAATAIDTLAVVGRNLGLPLVGSIELVQAAVLVSGVFGLIFATAGDGHARVRIVTDRLTRGRQLADWLAALSMALFYGALLAGSIWLAADLWHGHERSELLGVSWRALRMVANLGLATCIVVVFVALVRRREP